MRQKTAALAPEPVRPTPRTRRTAVVNTPKVAAVKKPVPKPVTGPTILEAICAGGHVWKMSGRHGVAYIKDAVLAGELLATDPKNLPKAAMAVYYDRKGKPFAWQVRFDTERWEEVTRRLG